MTFGLTANQDFVDCAPPGLYDMPPAQCASGTQSWSSHHAEIYRIDLGARTSGHLTTVAGTSIAWMSLSENSRELVWQTMVSQSSIDVHYYFQADHASYGMSYSSILSGQESCTGKKYDYRAFDPDPAASTPLGSSILLSEPVDDGCYADHSNLGGTIAPSRIPTIADGLFKASIPGTASAPTPVLRRATKRSRSSSIRR